MPYLAFRCVSTNLQPWLSIIPTLAASFAGCFRRCCCWISHGAGRPCFSSDSCKEPSCRARRGWHTFPSASARSCTPLTRLGVELLLRSGQRISPKELNCVIYNSCRPVQKLFWRFPGESNTPWPASEHRTVYSGLLRGQSVVKTSSQKVNSVILY